MNRHFNGCLFLCFASIAFIACNGKPAQDRPSGLKNMAPPPIQEAVQEGLDVEPNDTFLQAGDITLAGDAIQWAASLNSGNDVDVWHIKAKSGTIAEIIVTPEDAADLIVDYAPTSDESARRYYNTATSGDAEILPNIRLSPQGGYLTIKGNLRKDAENIKYRIQIQRLSADPAIFTESEPNDSQETALNPNLTSVKACLYPSGDVDFYRFSIEQPGTFSFNLPKSAIEVTIRNGDQIVWSTISHQQQIVKADILSAEKQNLLISVKSLEHLSKVIDYSFDFLPLDKIPDEFEPNDTIDKAQKLPEDFQALEFTLSSADDIDIFGLTLSSDQVYRAHLAGPATGQAKLQILDNGGNVRTDILSEDQVLCDFPVTQDPHVFLKVSSGAGNINYPLTYRIQLESEPLSQFEQEPNQNRGEAMNLQPGSVVKGHIFPQSDIDNYRIIVPEKPGVDGPVGELYLDIDAGYGAQLLLNLQDSEGYEISQIRSRDLNSPIHLAFDAPAGTYNLEVTGAGDGCRKPYTLHISLNDKDIAIPDMPEQIQPNDQPADGMTDDAIRDLIETAQKGTPTTPSNDSDEDGF